ncbi:MAG TPA: hypothetical protein VF975_05475 [Thermoanaerobaculia bacterium]
MLRGKGGFESLVGFPGSGDIRKIPTLPRNAGQTSAFRQRLNGRLVETLSGSARLFAERLIKDFRNAPNGILHAVTIGIAYK